MSSLEKILTLLTILQIVIAISNKNGNSSISFSEVEPEEHDRIVFSHETEKNHSIGVFPDRNDSHLYDKIDNRIEIKGFSTSTMTSQVTTTTAVPMPTIHDIRSPSCSLLRSSVFSCEGITDLITQVLVQMDHLLHESKEISSIEITRSALPTLNLTLFEDYTNLRNIAITESGIDFVTGIIGGNVESLNLSRNYIVLSSLGGIIPSPTKLRTIDLSYNHVQNGSLQQLPQSLFATNILLYLAGVHLDGQFIWGIVWEWLNATKSSNVTTFSKIFKDGDVALCKFQPPPSEFSLWGCLDAKKDLLDICNTANGEECSSCNLIRVSLQSNLEATIKGYPLSHNGSKGSIALSLEIDCSNRGLQYFPSSLPKQTWSLNISSNRIKDLTQLSQYPYLTTLDATDNQVDVETLRNTSFLSDFMSLGLRQNRIKKFPSWFIQAVKSVQNGEARGKGNVYVGRNYINCKEDCRTMIEMSSLLQSISWKTDWMEVYCHNGKPLKDVKCKIDTDSNATSSQTETWMMVIIVSECLLIPLVLVKVFYDRRSYRKTGKLPWLSTKVPRLPCDAMLEGKNPQIHNDRKMSGGGGSEHGPQPHEGVRGMAYSIARFFSKRIVDDPSKR